MADHADQEDEEVKLNRLEAEIGRRSVEIARLRKQMVAVREARDRRRIEAEKREVVKRCLDHYGSADEAIYVLHAALVEERRLGNGEQPDDSSLPVVPPADVSQSVARQ